ncbi:MAG: PqqD family protein [Elusimicrobiales bacterium]|nr:PqqD family protein [Elusimicrobiales bacterium]
MNLQIRKDLAYRRIAGELFIVDSAKAEMHELNGPAALIWEGLAAGKTERSLISAITAEFEVDEKTACEDLEAFLKTMQKAGLVSSVQPR